MQVMKSLVVLVMWALSVFSYAEEAVDVSPIVITYQRLVSSFDSNVSKNNFRAAFDDAKKLLDLDPSDTVAYLRLAIAARQLQLDGREIMDMYANEISEANAQEREIKAIANALFSGSSMKSVGKKTD